MSRSTVDLNRLVEEARRECLQEVERRDIAWSVQTLPKVEGDRTLLRQVAVNLISNAVKFTRQRAKAEITIGRDSGQAHEIVVFVRDNGVGFDMKYADKLFGVFQRLHRSEEFEGTGIGLANVRRIVERHGGRVWAEAALGSGATFYVSLPRSGGERT